MKNTALPQRSHFEVMTHLVKLKDAIALDIGCGEGRFTRMMASAGAKVTGIEPGPQQIRRALAQPQAGGETYREGGAEALDFPDGSVDLVVFFNSLHHVPVALMDSAMGEAARVLKTGGHLYIAEPLAEGPQFELSQPINDESEIRDKALEALQRGASHGLKEISETRYVADGKYTSFDAWRENSIAIDPARAPKFTALEQELRHRFESFGEHRDDGWHFPQPVRVNLLRKSA